MLNLLDLAESKSLARGKPGAKKHANKKLNVVVKYKNKKGNLAQTNASEIQTLMSNLLDLAIVNSK